MIIFNGGSIESNSELEMLTAAPKLICNDLLKQSIFFNFICPEILICCDLVFLNWFFLGFGSLEQIMATNGVGHTMEGSFMMVMDMLCHHLMTQACMLHHLLHMELTPFMETNNK